MTLSLFERELRVAVLASGSAGNCTYVGDRHGGVLIDCGVSTTQILRRLGDLGLGDAPIDAVLLTHEHSDHVGAARVLHRRLSRLRGRPVPFFMTPGTRRGLHTGVVPDAIEEISGGQTFRVGHLEVDCFPVPHDTNEPVAFRVQCGGTRVAVVTDLGRPTTLVASKLQGCAVAVLEFNHDFELLMGGPYPWALKQRIRSSHGHLSNEQSAQLLDAALHPDLRHVVLAHLSEKNNAPGRALAAATAVLRDRGALEQVALHVAQQHAALPVLSLKIPGW